jgi:uncharacterized LabA/DUF88 family protein
MSRYVSGIFLDFDNVYGSLHSASPKVANEFATRPRLWLDFLKEMPGSDRKEQSDHNFVIRRCYMNPVGKIPKDSGSFSQYRQLFVRDGWEVIDTPPLTNRGKTSADIHIVIDVMDAIQQFPHIDEYVIMAADADFTPLVIRLRKYMKRTVVYASKSTSAAYRQACDAQIDEADLIELFDEPDVEAPEPTGIPPRIVNARPVKSETDPPKNAMMAARVGGTAPITIERISSVIARYYIESGDGYEEAVPVLANLLKTEFGPEIMDGWAGCGSISQLLKRAGCVVEKNAEGRTFARLPVVQRVSLPPNI